MTASSDTRGNTSTPAKSAATSTTMRMMASSFALLSSSPTFPSQPAPRRRDTIGPMIVSTAPTATIIGTVTELPSATPASCSGPAWPATMVSTTPIPIFIRFAMYRGSMSTSSRLSSPLSTSLRSIFIPYIRLKQKPVPSCDGTDSASGTGFEPVLRA